MTGAGTHRDGASRPLARPGVRTAVALLVAGLAAASTVTANAGTPDPAKALAGANWAAADTVTVTMSEYAFSPATVTLRAGAPTRLVIRNGGKAHHYFVAEEFFRKIATRKIQSSDGEVKAPRFSAVEVYAGKSIDWYLVPLEAGEFDLVCTVPGHAGRGMKGKIVVR